MFTSYGPLLSSMHNVQSCHTNLPYVALAAGGPCLVMADDRGP